jgi:hypothetical protein
MFPGCGIVGYKFNEKTQKDCPVSTTPDTTRLPHVLRVKFVGSYSDDLTGGW